VVVVPPSELPEMARLPAESSFLYSDNAGATYLYVEQQQGARISVFDVTNPSRIRLTSTVSVGAAEPFDFLRTLQAQTELVRFRNGQGLAVLDLRNAKSPLLRKIDNSGGTQHPAASIVLTGTESSGPPIAATHDYTIVDTASGSEGAILATIHQVAGKAVNQDTGTTYLVGREGLTVIRQPRVEYEMRMHAAQ
jgi:hypothetical protein